MMRDRDRPRPPRPRDRARRPWPGPRAAPTPSSARSSCATASCSARAGTSSTAARTPRSTRSRLRRRRPARRDALRVARALLPRGPDTALHRRDPARGHRPRGRGQRRPDREGRRAAGWASCATRASRSTSPAASWPPARGCDNQAFRKHARTGRPWVLFKSAMTPRRQGRHAHGRLEVDLQRGEPRLAHRWRASVDAVAVGIGTALADDPQLTARIEGVHRQPRRVVFDSTARLPLDLAARRGTRRTCR